MLTGFHHVVLFCRDPERSREWYARAGFEYNRGYHGMHWFNAGPFEIMLHPAERGSGEHTPHLHIATSDVDRLFARTVAAGLEPLDHQQPGARLVGPVTRPWGEREFELVDPDGHRLIFTQG
jgi:catechol 2,3-dioxygenase-like lactoylglutathione lyase family enzyme